MGAMTLIEMNSVRRTLKKQYLCHKHNALVYKTKKIG